MRKEKKIGLLLSLGILVFTISSCIITDQSVFTSDNTYYESIEETEQKLEISNSKGREAKVYDVDDAIMYNGQIIMLEKVDKNVHPLTLLFGSPFEYGGYKDSYERIGYYPRKHLLVGPNIFTLKHLLSHCNANGRNAYNMYCSEAGDITCEAILNALKMYQDQVIRQLDSYDGELTDENLSNIFSLNKEKKLELIDKQYTEVIDYLCEQECFVWGSVPLSPNTLAFGKTSTEQEVMYKSAHGKNPKDFSNKWRMMQLLSEYVTLEEAENGLLEEQGTSKKKVIDRFVKQRV